MKIDVFTGPSGGRYDKNILENGHTTFPRPRTEFIGSIEQNGVAIPGTAMITIQE